MKIVLLLASLCVVAWAGGGQLCGSNITARPAADISVNKAGPDNMIIGNTLGLYQYQINIANAGPNISYAVVLEDTVPSDITVKSISWTYSNGPMSCARTGNAIRCELVYLRIGDKATLFVNVTVPSDAQPNPTLTNTAVVSSDEANGGTCDNDLTNNQNSAVSPLIASADNYVVIQGESFATAGQTDTVSEVVTVQNLGASDSPNTWSTFYIPEPLEFASVTHQCTSPGEPKPCCALIAPRVVNCSIGYLAKGATFQYEIEMTIPSDTLVATQGGTLVFRATVNSTTFDPNYGNNEATSYLLVQVDSNVGVTKSGPSGLTAGQTSQANPEYYNIVVENAGPSDATGVLLVDFIPTELTAYDNIEFTASCTKRKRTVAGREIIDPCTIVCSYPLRPTADPRLNNYLECTIDELKVNERALIKVPFSAGPGVLPQLITNWANVSSVTPDSDLNRNKDPHAFPITTLADPYIVKTGPEGVIISGTGATFQYQFTVGNNGPSNALQVTVTDTLNVDRLTLLSVSDGRCAVSGNFFQCAFGTLTPGQTITFTASFQEKGGFTGVQAVVPNCADVTSNTIITPDSNLDNNRDCTQFTLYQAPDVAVTKTGPVNITTQPTPVRTSYTITVTNNGPIATATNVYLTDTIPNFPYFVVPQNVAVYPVVVNNPNNEVRVFPPCSIVGNFVNCTIGTMVNGFSVRVVVPFDVQPATPANTYINVVNVFHTTPDTNITNNRDEWPTIVIRLADLEIIKRRPVEEVCAGDGPHNFTFEVHNLGPADAQNVQLTDTFDAAFTLDSPLVYTITGNVSPASCSAAGRTVTCSLGGIPYDGRVIVKIQFRVLANVPASPGVLNNASVTSFYDPNPANDWFAVNQPICNRAPLSLVKSVSSPTVVAGSGNTYTYTLVARNPEGPSDAVDVVLYDQVPAQWTVSLTSIQPPCTYNTATRNFTCTWPRLTPGQSQTVSFQFTVAQDILPQTVENCGLLWSAITPPNLENNKVRACVPVEVQNYADLFLNKAGPTCPVAGDGLIYEYSITIDNVNGPSRAESVVMTDPLPNGLDPVTPAVWAVSGAEAGYNCFWNGRVATCNLGGLNRFGIITIKIPFRVPQGFVPPGSVTNTATVTSARDNVPSNNNRTITTSICNLIDLAIIKDGPVQLSAGSPNVFEYNLTVTNNGPSDALSAVVTDNIPIDFVVQGNPSPSEFCSYEVISPAATTPYASNTRLRCVFPRINAGATAPIVRVFFTVASSVTPGQRENCARVDSGLATPQSESRYDNNEDCILTGVDVKADMSVSKVGPSEICAGFGGTFTVIVSNGGPATALNVVLTDNLPVQFTPGAVDYNPKNQSGLGCSFTGKVLTCNLRTMAPFTSYIITYSVTVATDVEAVPAPGVRNTVTVVSTTADGNTNNNNAYWDTRICANAALVTKKLAPAQVIAGTDGYLYTLQVTNTGPADARGVSLTDTVPADFVNIVIISRGTADECSLLGQVLTCTWFSKLFPVGTSTEITFSFGVKSSANIGARVNCFDTTSVTAPGGPVTACNTTQVIPKADLSITKSGPDVCAGDPEQYFTLVVRNFAGPSTARDITVSDTLPSGLIAGTGPITVDGIVVPASSSTKPYCNFFGNFFSCALPDMVVGAQHTIRFPFKVLSSERAKTVTNVATVQQATQEDPNPANNNGQDTVTISECANYGIVKTGPSEDVIAGDKKLQVFTLTVTNAGPSDARDVKVTDQTLNVNNVQIDSTDGASCQIVRDGDAQRIYCDVGYLAAGAPPVQIRIFWFAPADAIPGTYINCGLVNSTTPKVGLLPLLESCVPYVIKQTARLVTTKVGVTPIVAGENLGNQQFVVSVTNVGQSIAANAALTDQVPAIFKVTTVTPSRGTCAPVVNNLVSCTFGTLAPAESVTVIYKYTTLPDANLGSVPNTVCATTTSLQDDTSQNCDTFVTEVICRATLIPSKRSDIPNIVAGKGTIGTFTFTVTNAGPSTSKTTQMFDTWPPALRRIGSPQPSTYVCSDTSTGFFCNIGVLQPGETATITQQYTVDSDELTTVAFNRACATNACSSSEYCAQALVTISREVDLCIAKSDGVDEVEAGKEYTYTIRVTNKGPSDAHNVRVTDTFPVVLERLEIIAPGWICEDFAGFGFECLRTNVLVAGASDTLYVRFKVPATLAPGYVTNCVEVESDEDDIDKTNNEACDTDHVINFADLEIKKTIDSDVCVIAGKPTDTRTYTLTVTNLGPTTAKNVRVQERWPSELNLLSYDTERCSQEPANSGNYTCLLGDLAPGASVQLFWTFNVDECHPAGVVNNWANVTSDTTDPNLCNNVAELCNAICTEADLGITKTDHVMQVTAGDGVTYKYEICAYNLGPSCATQVQIHDHWPFHQWGHGQVWTVGEGSLTCMTMPDHDFMCTGSLNKGETKCVYVNYTVPACLEACEVCNTVSISSPNTPDPVPANNVATDCNEVRTEADVRICKSDGVVSVVAGDGVTYTYNVEVCNDGPSCAKDVRVLDHYPCEVERQGPANPSQGSCINTNDCNDFACNLGTLQPGQCVNITSSYKVPSSAETCSVTNVAVVSTVTFDGELCNNDAKDVNALLEHAALSIVKTGPATLNDFDRNPHTYTIVVTNLGVSTARDVVVTDRWPPELLQFLDRSTGVAITATGNTTCVTTGTDFSCAAGSIAVGHSVTIVATFTLKPHVPCGTIIHNVASAFSPTDTECREADWHTNVTCVSPAEKCINCVRAAALESTGACHDQYVECTRVASSPCAQCIANITVDPLAPPSVCFSDVAACHIMQCIYNDVCGLGADMAAERRECDSPFSEPITCPGDKKRQTLSHRAATFSKTEAVAPQKVVSSGAVLTPQKVNVEASIVGDRVEIKFKNILKMKVQIDDVALEVTSPAGIKRIQLGSKSESVKETTCGKSIKLRKDWTWSCSAALDHSVFAQATDVKVLAHGKAVVREGYHPIVGVQDVRVHKKK